MCESHCWYACPLTNKYVLTYIIIPSLSPPPPSLSLDRDNDPEAVNSQNDAGYTALHHAAKHGSIDLIQVLLRASADRMLENNAGETPYMVAHKYQQFDAERLLLNIEQAHG